MSLFREKYQQAMADRHYSRLQAAEESNFRTYRDRGYSADMRFGELLHHVGNRWQRVGWILKNGTVEWCADGSICGEVVDGKFAFYKNGGN
jgi:hypothetical protein